MAKSRKHTVLKLKKAFGDRCYWCGLVMDFPNYGKPDTFHKNMATVEHHIQKSKDTKHIMFLRLAHNGCNK